MAPELTFRLPNRPPQDPFKFIRVQVTLRMPGLFPDQGVLDIWSEPRSQWKVTGYGVEPTPIPELWHGWADITLWPNPYIEWIRLGSNQTAPFWWDQVVIDTWCPPVPEPMSMTLAGLGLFGVIGSRLRKR